MKVLRPKNVTTDTASPEKAQAVIFSSGALFFTHVTQWPPGVQSKDLPALVALSLEDISPFALESLAWGFCSDEESRTLFLYAACLPRISSAEQEAWPLAQQVYPSFLPLVADRSGAPATELPQAGSAGGTGTTTAAPWQTTESVAADTGAFAAASVREGRGAGASAAGSVPSARSDSSASADFTDSDSAGSDFTGSGLAGSRSVGFLPERELLLVGSEVLLLERGQGARWPRRIHSEQIDAAAEDGLTPQAVLEAAAGLLVRARICKDHASAHALLPQLPFWQLEQTALGRRNEVRFLLRGFSGTASPALSVTAAPVVSDAASVTAGTAAPAADVVSGGFENSATAANGTTEENANTASDVAGNGGESAVLQTALVGEEALWQADLRTDDFIAITRKRRLADLRLWYGLCAAAAAAVVLLVLLLAFGWLGIALKERAATLAAQAPAVERIRQDQDLLMRMRQFSADPFAPFNLIGTLKSGKPDPIYFDSIELSGPDAVLVEGQGPTVDAVNAYVRVLEQGGGFRAARQARMNLKDGASVFTLYLQYLGQPEQAQSPQPEG